MASKHPLYIAFIWHMHQPYYKDSSKNEYLMPWVRLHGIKDYFGMPHIIKEIPQAHMTFCLTPCLLEQLKDYSQDLEQDPFIKLTLKPVEKLTIEEKIFILKNFFLANWDNMVKVYQPYSSLLQKRGYYFSDEELQIKQRLISNKELRDIKVWHNLTWMDTWYQRNDSRVARLIERGKDFSQTDIESLVSIQKEIISKIIPQYKNLMEEGFIELITAPYYHPILPLLCDLNVAKVASPDIQIPGKGFIHPEDCRAQLEMGVDLHQSIFGIKPAGLWPSEGSVCSQIIPMLSDIGIQWLASDEDILAKSLNLSLDRDLQGCLINPSILYKPYWILNGGKKLIGLFRDRVLSDLISFVYHRWEIERSVEDFLSRLHMIHQRLSYEDKPGLVTIIMDGENAWEFYMHNGRDFLARLYGAITQDQDLKMVTVTEYLRQFPPTQQDRIEGLFPGSWINHNFKVWIGQEEENTAWSYLINARDALEGFKRSKGDGDGQVDDRIAMATKELYIAEGSDWFWWYGEKHFTEQADLFDIIFRQHLINFYKLLGLSVPNELFIPILIKRGRPESKEQSMDFLSPTFDGRVTTYYEWLPSVRFKVKRSGGTIHRTEGILKDIYYGFDKANLYVRLDTLQPLKGLELTFCLHFLSPKILTVEIHKENTSSDFSANVLEADDRGDIVKTHSIEKIAGNKILEIAIPFDYLQAGIKANVRFIVAIKKDNNEIERHPIQGYFLITTPYPGYEDTIWEP